jgi:four helix bundle protein
MNNYFVTFDRLLILIIKTLEDNMPQNILREKSRAFAIRIVKLYKYLCDSKKEYVLSKQILRSGTSIGANIHEADFSESKKDFIHKLHVALKETSETEYWLFVLLEADYLTENNSKQIKEECIEIMRLLQASINTAKKNLNDKQ